MKTIVSFIDDYQVLGQIGDGGQANVYLCTKNLKIYAVKVFNSGTFNSQPFHRETKFLSILQHQNIIRIFQSNRDAIIKYDDKTQVRRSIMVMDLAERGELFEYIKYTKAFQPSICKAIFNSILKGMEYMREKGIAHRDIKPENILFDNDFTIKISDFGLSTLSEGEDKSYLLKTKVGTEGFKAPEIDKGDYNGQKADVFSLGVVLFSMYAGSPPFFSTKSLDKIYKIIISKNFEKFWSIHQKNRAKGFFCVGFKKLINSLLSSNPDDRPTLQQLKQDSWLNHEVASAQDVKSELKVRFQKIKEECDEKYEILKVLQNTKLKLIKEQNLLNCGQSEKQTCLQNNIFVEDGAISQKV